MIENGSEIAGIPRAFFPAVTENAIVIPGPRRLDPGDLYQAAREFAWEFEVSEDLRTVAAAQAYRKTVTVFFHGSVRAVRLA
jgi:hypothetical protein